jgi:hypothetical protein
MIVVVVLHIYMILGLVGLVLTNFEDEISLRREGCKDPYFLDII